MPERTCAVDRCPKPHYGLGYCKLHYRRFKSHGSTDKPQREQRGCTVDGCGEKHYSVGFCQLHYNRQWRTGSTDVGIVGERTYTCWGCGELVVRDAKMLGGSPRWCPSCSVRARQLARTKWYEVNGPERVTEYECKHCGCRFCYIVPDGQPRTICSACLPHEAVLRAARYARRYPEKVAESRARGHQRRRARLKGARAERVDRAIVYALGNWTCHLCRRAIDPELRYPDPMSASVDHVVPLLPGRTPEERATLEHGEHTYENTRPAHLRCNLRKGNRMIERISS